MASESITLLLAAAPYLLPLLEKGVQLIFPGGQTIKSPEELRALIAEIEALPHVTPDPEPPGLLKRLFGLTK